MLILLSQNEQGISALDLQKHIFPSGSSSMKSTFPWMQRHYVNYYKGEQLYETNRRETALTHPRGIIQVHLNYRVFNILYINQIDI
jgi:hypothetical protein